MNRGRSRGGAWARACAWWAVAAAGVGPASADTPRATPAAIEVDREDAPPGRAELGFDGGAPVDGWGLTLAGGWLEGPVALDVAGERTRPVRRRQTLGLGGALALGQSVVLDARFAVAHQVGDRLKPLDPRALDRYVPLDLRLGVRIRVAGGPKGALFARGELTLPTGDDHDFAGEASWAVAWQLIGRLGLPGGLVAAASAGIRLRGAEVLVGDRLLGDELVGAVGVVAPLPALRPLWCRDQVKLTAELAGAAGDDVGMGRGPSPVEARIGLVVAPRPAFAIAVRAARGLVDQIGAPDARVIVELTYRGAGQVIAPVGREEPGEPE